MKKSILNDNRKEVFRLYEDGISYSNIGKKYGVTKNSVAGFLNSTGAIKRKNNVNVNVYEKPLIESVKPKAKVPQPTKVAIKKPIIDEEFDDMKATAEQNQCKFLSGDTPYVRCQNTITFKPYCSEHNALCYVSYKRKCPIIPVHDMGDNNEL